MIKQEDRDAASAAILQAAIELDSDDVDNDDWLVEAFSAHRIAAEQAVLQNGVNCANCGVRLPKDYEKQCPDCGFPHIPANALADILEQQP